MSREDNGKFSAKRKRSSSPAPASSSTSHNHNNDRSLTHSGKSSDQPIYTTRAQIGKPAPDFTDVPALVNGVFKEISLKSYLGRYLIIVFYPQDFTYVCPTEIIAFSDRLAEFRDIDTDVIAVSVDSKYSHLAWYNTPQEKGGVGNVKIPLLSDATRQISKDYGVYDEDLGFAIRGLFIVDPKGILKHAVMNDVGVGRSVDETKRVLTALQYVSEYGDVCPVNWQEGMATINPDPDGAKEYFKLHAKH
ncbi:Peroxiredoxin-4 [Hypsibius exemplaris]|uniref:thioredoxin-dependent peroxiredoxin n=1 Tax=Hypsibius exemplaris TaxID=2072580 RepID=A0A1W0WGM0_HYPEX|nr:Peroxiredoxin-4 [Hypsibius exemplaris]